MKNDVKKYMNEWNLNFDLEEKVKKEMAEWELPLDLLDVYMTWNGDIIFEARGMAPADEKEERMILVGHIDDEELWLN